MIMTTVVGGLTDWLTANANGSNAVECPPPELQGAYLGLHAPLGHLQGAREAIVDGVAVRILAHRL